MALNNIRNFSILAHIDHGKSTLADRMLEVTKTVEARKMKEQILDSMDLERERGITIKMAPVRMEYNYQREYILNLIDTPGHSDFSYEVSRAMQAVEGAILLVDATQGIQAQTLANFENAKKVGLKMIGVVNKVDVAAEAQVDSAILDLAELLGVDTDEIIKASGKTGEGVNEILNRIVEVVPAPTEKEYKTKAARALIFDSEYDEHRGVIAFVRVFSGRFDINGNYSFVATGAKFKAKDIGYLKPKFTTNDVIENGEIGYIATGIKDPDALKIGDTVSNSSSGEGLALPGYQDVMPVVFVSFYPEDASDYNDFVKALSKLRLSDSALVFEPDKSEVLGRGFKGGFLGRLHFEIVSERIEREFDIETISSFPSVAYRVKLRNTDDWMIVNNPKDFPDDYSEVEEPMAQIEILTKSEYLGAIMGLSDLYRISAMHTENVGSERIRVSAKLPLADLISDFDDRLKSVSAGFASLSYELSGYSPGELGKMEILVAEAVVPGLTRILPKEDIEREGRRTVEKLKDLLPKLQFKQAIQARCKGRIIARETLPALKKDVTGYLYGGDITRKQKLWKKQAKGKKKLLERGAGSQVHVPANVFKELLKK
ncbi:MAG: translation elongation factor 4 [bacterium]|nr:translation elongation factor 4 [bacterium]